MVLKSKTTVVEYRAWSPGEFRTLKTRLVFVLKGFDSILLNKSYNCSFCFMLFFLLRELDMNEGDLRVCLVSLLKQSHEGTCSPFLKKSWISSSKEPFSTNEHSISSTPGPRCYHGEDEQTLFCLQEAQLLFFINLIFHLLWQLYPVCCLWGQSHIWRAGIRILSHQLWNHRPLPTRQAFDEWVFSLLFHIWELE